MREPRFRYIIGSLNCSCAVKRCHRSQISGQHSSHARGSLQFAPSRSTTGRIFGGEKGGDKLGEALPLPADLFRLLPCLRGLFGRSCALQRYTCASPPLSLQRLSATRPVMAQHQQERDPPLADRGWVDVQKKTFTNWVNDRLKGTERKVDDLETDFDDGITLITLLEVLAPGKKMPGRCACVAYVRACVRACFNAISAASCLMTTTNRFSTTPVVYTSTL